MKREEVIDILGTLRRAYPKYYYDMPLNDQNGIVETWLSVLRSYEYDVVHDAVLDFIRKDTKGFPPIIGQIMNTLPKNKRAGMRKYAVAHGKEPPCKIVNENAGTVGSIIQEHYPLDCVACRRKGTESCWSYLTTEVPV